MVCWHVRADQPGQFFNEKICNCPGCGYCWRKEADPDYPDAGLFKCYQHSKTATRKPNPLRARCRGCEKTPCCGCAAVLKYNNESQVAAMLESRRNPGDETYPRMHPDAPPREGILLNQKGDPPRQPPPPPRGSVSASSSINNSNQPDLSGRIEQLERLVAEQGQTIAQLQRDVRHERECRHRRRQRLERKSSEETA